MDAKEFLDVTSDPKKRVSRYEDLVNTYYDWATTTFPSTWGGRLHFAKLEGDTSFEDSCINQEGFLSDMLELRVGFRCLDMGCGLGAPARYIAERSKVHVTGVDLSERRVDLAREEARKEGLADLCEFQVGTVTALPHEENCFDAVYSIEVGAHVPDKREFFNEAARVLKPGKIFAGWDWALLRCPTSEEHEKFIEPLLKYHGIANFLTTEEMRKCLLDSGFEVLYYANEGASGTRDWWSESARRNMAAGLVPEAQRTPEVSILLETGRALVKAGSEGILTPLQFWKARKR